MTQPTSKTRPLTSARRTLEVLDAISTFRRPFRAPDLAGALGWSRATTYQQLVTLVTAGWLDRGPDGDYRLSVRASRISSAAAAQAAPAERLFTVLHELVAETHEAASIALLDEFYARVLWRVVPDRPVSASVPRVTTLSARSASVHVLLAYLPAERRRQLRRATPPKSGFLSERTLTAVRKAGHAIYHSADPDGVAAVAAPIFDAERSCAATLAVTGPSSRFEPESAIDATVTAAERISEVWQYVGDPAQDYGLKGHQSAGHYRDLVHPVESK